MKEIAEIMSRETGLVINEQLIVKLPSDGAVHMGNSWEVYSARCGEFTIMVYQFADGRFGKVKVI